MTGILATMEKQLSSLISVLEQTVSGDEHCFELLNLHEDFRPRPHFDVPPPLNPDEVDKTKLEEDIMQTLFFASAAHQLHLDTSRDVALRCLSYSKYVYKCLYKKRLNLPEILDAQDLADEILKIVNDLCNFTALLESVNRDIREKLRKAEETEGMTLEEEADESEDQGNGDDNIKSEEPKKLEKTDHPKLMTLEKEQADEIEANNTEKPESGDDETKSEEPEKEEARAENEREQELGYTGGRNNIRACPPCDFKGTQLARHLKSQHPEKCMSSKDVSRLVAISDKKLKQLGAVLTASKNQRENTYTKVDTEDAPQLLNGWASIYDKPTT